tara:strand:+ start:272 stop:1489 length:1218 start_codon:yes stop_codon:yes gene_type:complete
MDYKESIEFLFLQLPMYQKQGNSAYKKDLSNTLALCKKLDNPHLKFKSIHIAGTNGKGSVAHMLASIFQSHGYTTGLYTSPHLKDFRERIKINGKMISEEEVISFIENKKEDFKNIHPSFFEWTVALAFDTFANRKVDVAIIETGLGGRLDSTNVISPTLSVITNIGLDHTELLGDTLEKIAFEKAGIIKPNTPVVIGNSSKQKKLFESIALERNSKIIFAEDFKIKDEIQSDLIGNYQKENIHTVLTSVEELNHQGWNLNQEIVKTALQKVKFNTGLRGRYEVLKEQPKTIADTAHNFEGLSIVLNQLQKESYNKLHIVLGLVKEKAIDRILPLFPKDAIYYFCQAKIPRAMDVNELQSNAHKFHLEGNVYQSVEQAINSAKNAATPSDLIYIGGSTFVVAEAL